MFNIMMEIMTLQPKTHRTWRIMLKVLPEEMSLIAISTILILIQEREDEKKEVDSKKEKEAEEK